jgi:hypothetical protein
MHASPVGLFRTNIFISFKDAAASIRRTSTEFNYQLVIQRAYEEGEEQLLESDDDDLDAGFLLLFVELLTVQEVPMKECFCSMKLFTFAAVL